MPWISVHDDVDGPKLRKLYKSIGCSKFEATGILVFLWFWGLNNADQSGRIQFIDAEDIQRELYGVGNGCKLDMEKVVRSLIDTGWIDIEEEGTFKLHDWEVWQSQWYKAIERRKHDVERKARAKAKEDDSNQSSEVPNVPECDNESGKSIGNPAEIPSEPSASTGIRNEAKEPNNEPPDSQPKKKAYKPSFEEFWAEYPRHEGKGEAYIKYKARLKDGWSETELLRAAKNYAYRISKNHTEKQYIKQAKTFLSENTPFIDYLPEKKKEDRPQVPSTSNPFAEYKDE